MTSPDDLTSYIQKAVAWNTPRHTIDQQLLTDGYNPADIDDAWQQIQVRSTPPSKPIINLYQVSTVLSIARWVLLGAAALVIMGSVVTGAWLFCVWMLISLADLGLKGYLKRRNPPNGQEII